MHLEITYYLYLPFNYWFGASWSWDSSFSNIFLRRLWLIFPHFTVGACSDSKRNSFSETTDWWCAMPIWTPPVCPFFPHFLLTSKTMRWIWHFVFVYYFALKLFHLTTKSDLPHSLYFDEHIFNPVSTFLYLLHAKAQYFILCRYERRFSELNVCIQVRMVKLIFALLLCRFVS